MIETSFLERLFEIVSDFGIRVIIAIIILLFGKLIIKLIKKSINKIMQKQNIDVARYCHGSVCSIDRVEQVSAYF